jgi:hypothetical protein
MRTIQKHKVMVFCGLIVILFAAWIVAADYTSGRTQTTRENTFIVGPQKSDMQRLIEAYESLSAQYLTLVQQNLQLMASQDQQILTKLENMEKKIDALTAEVNKLRESCEGKDVKP